MSADEFFAAFEVGSPAFAHVRFDPPPPSESRSHPGAGSMRDFEHFTSPLLHEGLPLPSLRSQDTELPNCNALRMNARFPSYSCALPTTFVERWTETDHGSQMPGSSMPVGMHSGPNFDGFLPSKTVVNSDNHGACETTEPFSHRSERQMACSEDPVLTGDPGPALASPSSRRVTGRKTRQRGRPFLSDLPRSVEVGGMDESIGDMHGAARKKYRSNSNSPVVSVSASEDPVGRYREGMEDSLTDSPPNSDSMHRRLREAMGCFSEVGHFSDARPPRADSSDVFEERTGWMGPPPPVLPLSMGSVGSRSAHHRDGPHVPMPVSRQLGTSPFASTWRHRPRQTTPQHLPSQRPDDDAAISAQRSMQHPEAWREVAALGSNSMDAGSMRRRVGMQERERGQSRDFSQEDELPRHRQIDEDLPPYAFARTLDIRYRRSRPSEGPLAPPDDPRSSEHAEMPMPAWSSRAAPRPPSSHRDLDRRGRGHLGRSSRAGRLRESELDSLLGEAMTMSSWHRRLGLGSFGLECPPFFHMTPPSGTNSLLGLAFVDRDFTPDDYDMLLRLDEQLPSKGASQEVIDRIPCEIVEVAGQGSCCICISDFERREKIRRLPCNHAYHQPCIDTWLKVNRTCPICKLEVS
eukprot:CAMPEP_0196661198 /NCGR_PEP_ID=MMETSP1086-20130531/43185_1 /TAXON_ID=77921 /ORGANISM="Cyanoptyche  gloeocystis , Strain SAG4.97" /LENGTH=634 /DNA_ID=CAMNT_0041995985 /DNA_START=15 /DNA_END=1919 /DNA_ORIENTATION=+